MPQNFKLIAKAHDVGGIITLAICDPELLNKTLIGPRGVKVTIRECFYGTQEFHSEELKDFLRIAVSINAIGEKSVEFLIANGYGSRKSVIMLGDVPHLLIMKL